MRIAVSPAPTFQARRRWRVVLGLFTLIAMAAHCPKCHAPLAWTKMKKAFSCRSCNAALTANTLGPWVGTIVLWTLADLPLRATIVAPDGLAGVGVVLIRSLISFGIGYLIGSVVVGSFSNVSLVPDETQKL